MRAAGGVAATAAIALVAGCRDAPELLEPPELPALEGSVYQLTYDPGREVSPTWTATGDSVIYVTERLIPPEPPAIDTFRIGRPLRVIHRQGGAAGRVFPQLQTADDATVPIDYAVQSSDGRVAGFTLLPPLPVGLCGATVAVCTPDLPAELAPRLDAGVLRVREPGASTPPAADPMLRVEFPGREFDTSQNPGGFSGVWQVGVHPFQRRFSAVRKAPSRVSWSPDGDRVVFSDGVSLQLWNPSTGSVTPIPDTEDGVDPAWSPTGDWIAFQRYEKGALTEATCEHRQAPIPPETEPGPVQCIEQRRTWPLLGSTLALIRPDGTDLRLLPEGTRPAWAVDGARLYYEFDEAIWSVGVDGSDASRVGSTGRGFHPAVSPDGRWLAFARIDSLSAASDIWIVELP